MFFAFSLFLRRIKFFRNFIKNNRHSGTVFLRYLFEYLGIEVDAASVIDFTSKLFSSSTFQLEFEIDVANEERNSVQFALAKLNLVFATEDSLTRLLEAN